MDVEGAARHECGARWLQRMSTERRPLRRPRRYSYDAYTSSCEALPLGGDGHWSPLPPMHDTRANFACAAVAGCIIVAGGFPQRKSAEAYDEVLGRWLRLPHDLPHDGGLHGMGSALL